MCSFSSDRVALQLDDLQAIAQRRRQRVEGVRGADEDHLGQIEGQLQVVIGEGLVLLGIEHLEQGALGVAGPALTQLVDLVEQHDRVLDAGLGHGAQDAAGQGADVGAAMTAHLGLVAHAAERHAHERPARGVGDRLPERGLAHARRTGQAQDRAALSAGHLAHGQVLEDALLDVLEAVVVGVELGLDPRDLVIGIDALVPGQLGDPAPGT